MNDDHRTCRDPGCHPSCYCGLIDDYCGAL
jgi:hypothetical protein